MLTNINDEKSASMHVRSKVDRRQENSRLRSGRTKVRKGDHFSTPAVSFRSVYSGETSNSLVDVLPSSREGIS